MKKTIIHKVSASKTRLSDEEVDPLEKDDQDAMPEQVADGWLPWDNDDITDVKRLVFERMEERQREVIVAFLEGKSYVEANVTEKYWRWHFDLAIQFIRKELKL